MATKLRDSNVQIGGGWSFISLMALTTGLAFYFDGFSQLWTGFTAFYSGDVEGTRGAHDCLVGMMPEVFAGVVVDVVFSFASFFAVNAILGESRGVEDLSRDKYNKNGKLFKTFFVIMLLEEVGARWLFLGVIPYLIPAFQTGPMLYVLLFVGNAIWAYIHVFNFKVPEDRHFLRTLPQFLGGFFLGYIFVKYGLIPATIAHFAYNSVVFTFHKKQKTDGVDVLIVSWWLLVCGVTYGLMNKPPSETLVWFSGSPSFQLEGWEFWDYIKFHLFVMGVAGVILGLVNLDRPNLRGTPSETNDSKEGQNFNFIGLVIILAVTGIIVVWTVYLGYWLMGFLALPFVCRVLATSIWLSFSEKSNSLSAVSRTFWGKLPSSYVLICIINALTFWDGVWYVAVMATCLLPWLVLKSIDD